ncbi:hypothetical protein ACFXKT_10580, partial [Streptomyces mirabilis]
MAAPVSGVDSGSGVSETFPVGATTGPESAGAPTATYPPPLPPSPHAASTAPRQTTAVEAPTRAP